jgi:alginate O-acetyltransferase complex protein AlgI
MMQLSRLLAQGILAGEGINNGFDVASHWSGPDVWCLVFGYGLQLFFDFAGYSHIAIGAANILGFTLPENFARPFESTSVSIFWTRWHMSLSFWIRDYVFLPMAVLRREIWWRNVALLISMVMFGVWHKATLLFVLWGFYQGTLLILHRQWQQLQRRFNWETSAPIWTPFFWVVTIFMVSLGWILFRANSLSEAGQMLSAVLSPAGYSSHFVHYSLYLLVIALAFGYAIVLLVSDVLRKYATGAEPIIGHNQKILVRIAHIRWYWVPPLYVLTLLLSLFVTLTRGDSTSGLMYRGF